MCNVASSSVSLTNLWNIGVSTNVLITFNGRYYIYSNSYQYNACLQLGEQYKNLIFSEA